MQDSQNLVDEVFIRMYRSEPCLWQKNKTLPNSCNSAKEKAALKRLLKHLRETEPTATVDDVKRKISHMRKAYRKQLKEIADSIISESEEACKPTLWYYHLLTFLQDQEVSLQSDEDEMETGRKTEECIKIELVEIDSMDSSSRSEDSAHNPTASLAEECLQSTEDSRNNSSLSFNQTHSQPNHTAGHRSPAAPQQNRTVSQQNRTAPHAAGQHSPYIHGMAGGQRSRVSSEQNQAAAHPIPYSQAVPQQNRTVSQQNHAAGQHRKCSSEPNHTAAVQNSRSSTQQKSATDALTSMATIYDNGGVAPKRFALPQSEDKNTAAKRNRKDSPATPSAPRDRFDAVGNLVAMKLRALPKEKSLRVEKFIHDMLFEVEMVNWQMMPLTVSQYPLYPRLPANNSQVPGAYYDQRQHQPGPYPRTSGH